MAEEEMQLNRFLVPQFIDVESKIIGPITTRQFLIMLIAGMICFVFYKIFYFNTFLIASFIVVSLFGIVAFVRINGMPFHYFFINMLQTLRRPRIRVWAKIELAALPQEEKAEIKKEFIAKAPLAKSRLTSLSLVVNTGGAFREEQ